jgi:hypothetical protein
MGWQKDTLTGLAVRYDSLGIGTWRTSTALGTIVLGALPDEIDLGIGLHGYRVGPDDPAQPHDAAAGPVLAPRRRGRDRRSRLAGVRRHDRPRRPALGAATVTLARSLSSIPMGVDGRGRAERACNYALDLDLPPTALRSY